MSFMWGFGDAWGMLQGYVGLLLDNSLVYIFIHFLEKDPWDWILNTYIWLDVMVDVLTGWWFFCHPFENICSFKLDHFPKDPGEKQRNI